MLCTMLYTGFLMLKCLHSTQKDLKLNLHHKIINYFFWKTGTSILFLPLCLSSLENGHYIKIRVHHLASLVHCSGSCHTYLLCINFQPSECSLTYKKWSMLTISMGTKSITLCVSFYLELCTNFMQRWTKLRADFVSVLQGVLNLLLVSIEINPLQTLKFHKQYYTSHWNL